MLLFSAGLWQFPSSMASSGTTSPSTRSTPGTATRAACSSGACSTRLGNLLYLLLADNFVPLGWIRTLELDLFFLQKLIVQEKYLFAFSQKLYPKILIFDPFPVLPSCYFYFIIRGTLIQPCPKFDWNDLNALLIFYPSGFLSLDLCLWRILRFRF